MDFSPKFIRAIFYLALSCAVLAAIVCVLLPFNTIFPIWVDQLAGYAILASFAGLFLSIILANFVRCGSCGEKALVFPNSPKLNADTENLHQPWRNTCGRCGCQL